MALKLSVEEAFRIAMSGKLYNPAKLHYHRDSTVNLDVVQAHIKESSGIDDVYFQIRCDLCQTCIEESYGFDDEDHDLCKSCRINILKHYKNQIDEKINLSQQCDLQQPQQQPQPQSQPQSQSRPGPLAPETLVTGPLVSGAKRPRSPKNQ
jgi:hypothetical protein